MQLYFYLPYPDWTFVLRAVSLTSMGTWSVALDVGASCDGGSHGVTVVHRCTLEGGGEPRRRAKNTGESSNHMRLRLKSYGVARDVRATHTRFPPEASSVAVQACMARPGHLAQAFNWNGS